MGADEDDEDGFGDTLKAYEYAKRETLATEGTAPLRRELAELTAFLESERGPYMENVDVDEEFREAKAEVLREILAEAQAEDESSGDD